MQSTAKAQTGARISDAEKRELIKGAENGTASRVPLIWGVNPRIILLNPELNPEGYTFEKYFHDPHIHLLIQAKYFEYKHEVLGSVSDLASDLPEEWPFCADSQNIYDAAYFGAEIIFSKDQVPVTHEFMTEDDAEDFAARDFSQPLENDWLCRRMEFHKKLCHEAETFTYKGRKGSVAPFSIGFDGPLTVATNLFGGDIHMLLAAEPELAEKVLTTITRAVIVRNKSVKKLYGLPEKESKVIGLADDSIQLIGTDTYVNHVMPLHELWYREMAEPTAKRYIHLCGDATRHFPTIKEKLGVCCFDTGFPVDFGRLRKELGPDILIQGGPEAPLVCTGTPEECAKRTREILQSGIMEGRRFIMREGNNLPPLTPVENLRAVYETCLEYGRYE